MTGGKLFITMLATMLMLVASVSAANSGAIWTTNGDCGDSNQDVNHFAIGDVVYVNGDNFAEGNYSWDIRGNPGGSSCDPNIYVAAGIENIDETGAFCFEAYTVANDDCGEYKVEFESAKSDNYRVNGEDDEPVDEVPEFGVIASIAVLASAGAFIYKRRN